MKFPDKIFLLGVIFIIIGISILIIGSLDVEIKDDLPCYDKYGKEINGIKCSGSEPMNSFYALISALIILFGYFVIIHAGLTDI